MFVRVLLLLVGVVANTARYAYDHLIQPVIPTRIPSLGEDWVLVDRPTIA